MRSYEVHAALFVALAAPSLATAQSVRAFPLARAEDAGFSSTRLARIDSALNALVAEHKVPGAVVFISRGGKTVVHKAYGYRDVRTKAPMQPGDIFRIASQTKAIVSLAVMMLWEEGRFQLDDPVGRYIPEFARSTVIDTFRAADTTWTVKPAPRPVSIRHLLTHTSGLDYPGIGSASFRAIYAKAGIPSGIGVGSATIGEKMRALGTLPLAHAPGDRFTYGLNSDLLGYFVEVISGVPLDQFLRTRIFEPLGMRDTWFYLPQDRASRLVTLHRGQNGRVVPADTANENGFIANFPLTTGTYFSGGAGLSSTAEDYARFLQLFLNRGELNGVRLLSPKTVELMLTDQTPALTTEFGLGFGLETSANDHLSPKSIGSFSWGGAFATTYWADPKEQLIAQIYTNVSGSPVPGLSALFTTLTYAAIIK